MNLILNIYNDRKRERRRGRRGEREREKGFFYSMNLPFPH